MMEQNDQVSTGIMLLQANLTGISVREYEQLLENAENDTTYCSFIASLSISKLEFLL